MQPRSIHTGTCAVYASFFNRAYEHSVIGVELDGDNEDDGDVDEEDDSVESTLPIVVACNSDTNTLIVRAIGYIPGTLKIKKSGQGRVILQRSDGSTMLGENAAESGDILSEVEIGDLSLNLNGTVVGSAELVLEYANGSVSCADTVAIKVVQSDLVQRSGNVHLAALISETRTHTGIHWQQYVTDLYDPGIEQVSLSIFESLADGGPDKKRLRPKKSLFMARRVWASIYDNMQAQSYTLPSLAQPWNIFTTADDYSTANCNEFVNEQIRYAITQVHEQLSEPAQRSVFESAWYIGTSVQPLVNAKHLVLFSGKAPNAGAIIFGMETALNFRSKLVEASTQFQNHYEGHILDFAWHPGSGIRYSSGTGTSASCPGCGINYPPAPWYHIFSLEYWDEAHHNTVTPDNFVESSWFEQIPY